MTHDYMITEKAHGVRYAWHESFPKRTCFAKRKRDAVQAVHRTFTRGVEGESVNFRIMIRLIGRPKKNGHPTLFKVARGQGRLWG